MVGSRDALRQKEHANRRTTPPRTRFPSFENCCGSLVENPGCRADDGDAIPMTSSRPPLRKKDLAWIHVVLGHRRGVMAGSVGDLLAGLEYGRRQCHASSGFARSLYDPFTAFEWSWATGAAGAGVGVGDLLAALEYECPRRHRLFDAQSTGADRIGRVREDPLRSLCLDSSRPGPQQRRRSGG
jgi:hypothetical protein